ncbi:hypothetical protein BD626DRAFT_563519 [Schizophyllum amplum]|uniref:Inhibitor I9 domain-containing protein n=1 Tax=Schizophyllum amplum TaxID=97359 RepID=A0A550CYD1_9AGAR|nr:hypothetical protein BD626DRAFT_563519 [Auriculariopsis ampla]
MAPVKHMMNMDHGHMMDMMGSSTSHSKCVVVFKEGTTEAEIKQHADEIEAQGGYVTEMYDYLLKGFSAFVPESYLMHLQSLTGSGGVVDYIERDTTVSI